MEVPIMADKTLSPKRKTPKAPAKLSRTKRPEGMSLEEWQIGLRREHGRTQTFDIKKLGDDNEFSVKNTQSQSSYHVIIRGKELGDNSCTCGDFQTNGLGTCKHIEFTLGYLETKRGGKQALERGIRPEYSEIYLRYGKKREVCFRAGDDCPVPLIRLVDRYFSDEGVLLSDAAPKFETLLDDAKGFDHELRVRDDVLRWLA
jgi:hypothetical protein